MAGEPIPVASLVEVDSGVGARKDSPPLNFASSPPTPRRFSACPSLSLISCAGSVPAIFFLNGVPAVDAGLYNEAF
jgi:hypothetical protein